MAWFKSRKNPGGQQQMDYLNATDTTVRPLALPSLLIALLLVSAITFLLFVIARWGYQEISKSDVPSSTEVASPSPDTSTGETSTSESSGTSNENQGSNTTDNQGTTSATTTDSPTVTTPSTGTEDTSSTAGTNQANTVSQTETIPNTGSSSMVGIFTVTVVLGTLGYYAATIRSLQQSR